MSYLKRKQRLGEHSIKWTSIKPEPKPKKCRRSTIAQDWLIVCLIYVALVGVIMMWTL